MIDEVILVDKDDQELGTCEKMEAHKLGLMHRAFSVLLYNSKGEMLLQQRADHKYHSAGLWSNACCSHPRPGESMEDAVARRLQEELGVVCKVKEIDRFVYHADFENGLQEHEL
ncbi:MAG: isopentenyl-diphosphate delta-isomerase, partial [Cyclobacteriaceae bacterium]